MMNPLRFACTNCGSGLQVDSRAAGFEIDCPQCGEILVVPGPSAKPATPKKEPEGPPPPPPPPISKERVAPQVKFCIGCSKDVPEGELICPHCGGGRFGRL